MFDAIVVGSGPAGVMAAWALRGNNVLVLDVGKKPASLPGAFENNLYDERRRQADLFEFLIGRRFESLHNVYNKPANLKLKAPFMRYVVEDAESLSPVRPGNFDAAQSFAAGGLANAWGAGVYRFTPRDLAGFPVTLADLDPYYDELTRHIGVSGDGDGLQPPVDLSRFASDLLVGYQRKQAIFGAKGLSIGRARLAVLTQPHRGRQPYAYGNYEFFRPYDPAVYNPVYTLRELIEAGQIEYEPEQLVVSYRETECGVEVTARNLATGSHAIFEGRTLVLAAGALNSARIVLESNRDYEMRLPLLDNPMACVPLFRLKRMGQKLDSRDTSIGQLCLIQQTQGAVLQGSIYGVAGPLKSDILFDLPLSISANTTFLRRLAVATGLLMMFYPAEPHPENYLRLRDNGALEMNYGRPEAGGPPRGAAEKELIRIFRKIGFYSSSALCRNLPMGSSIHYAGTLPMRAEPGRYELYPDGRLQGTRAVYVADGACFPRLPAKNLTFTIMANAMRIATRIRERLS